MSFFTKFPDGESSVKKTYGLPCDPSLVSTLKEKGALTDYAVVPSNILVIPRYDIEKNDVVPSPSRQRIPIPGRHSKDKKNDQLCVFVNGKYIVLGKIFQLLEDNKKYILFYIEKWTDRLNCFLRPYNSAMNSLIRLLLAINKRNEKNPHSIIPSLPIEILIIILEAYFSKIFVCIRMDSFSQKQTHMLLIEDGGR